MQILNLDFLSSKELFKDVLVRIVGGDEIFLNYFELKNMSVSIPFHGHPVEHLIVLLEGEIDFIFEDHKLSLKEKDFLFLPANKHHSARVIRAPVKALEIFKQGKDEYYDG